MPHAKPAKDAKAMKLPVAEMRSPNGGWVLNHQHSAFASSSVSFASAV